MNQGLITGLGTIAFGLNPSRAAAKLTTYRFRQPTQQKFPATAAAFATKVGEALAVPSSVWLCEGTVDTAALVDEESNVNLIQTGATPLQGQVAMGFHNGADFVSKRAIEAVSTTSRWHDADNTVYDHTTNSFAQVTIFRCKGKLDQYLLRKRATTGYYKRVTVTGALWWFLIGASDNHLVQHAGNYNDGAWHIAITGFHSGDQESHIHTDQGDTVQAAAGLGSLTNTDNFTICDSAPDTQVAYSVHLEGAAAEALLDLGSTAIANLWEHGLDPNAQITMDRAGIVSVPVNAAGNICHFATDAIAIGYNPAFSDSTKLALVINDATENLVPNSEQLGLWADNSTVALFTNFADAPDGFRSATKVRTTSPGGHLGTIFPTVASTQYTLSLYIEEAEIAAVDGRIVFYDISNGAEIAAQAFTTSPTRERVTLTATTAVGQVSSSFRIELTSTNDDVTAWGAQCELGAYATTYVRTLGTAVTSVRGNPSTQAVVTNSSMGEIKCTYVNTANVSLGVVYNIISNTGNQNRRRLIQSPTTCSVTLYDGAGLTEDSVVLIHGGVIEEMVLRFIWDDSLDGALTGGRESVLVNNGAALNGQPSPWDGTIGGNTVMARLDLGSIGGSFVQPCFIQELIIYDGLSAAIP